MHYDLDAAALALKKTYNTSKISLSVLDNTFIK